MRSRRELLVAVALLTAAGVIAWRSTSGARNLDLISLYCGSHLASAGVDPYLLKPLASCERANWGKGTGIVLPAPQPGYDFAILALPAKLPFRVFEAPYFAIVLASLLLIAFAIGRLIQETPVVPLAALLPMSLLSASFYGGEKLLPFIAVAGICVSALLLSRKRYLGAAIAAAVAMCEPLVGFPAVLAMLLFVPRSRIATILCLGALAALSIAALGLRTNVEYATAALPIHARSEIAFPAQFGLAWVAHVFGTSDRAAVVIGNLCFVISLIVFLALARRVAFISARPEALVLLPPLAALCGSVYLHFWNFIVAVPAALVLAYCFAGTRWTRAIALLLIAVPWYVLTLWTSKSPFWWVTIASVVICAAYVSRRFLRGSEKIAAFALAAGVITLEIIANVHKLPATIASPDGARKVASFPFAPNALASSYWAMFVHEAYAGKDELNRDFIAKIPTWLGFAMLITSMARVVRTTCAQSR
jgi:hypothetical protein